MARPLSVNYPPSSEAASSEWRTEKVVSETLRSFCMTSRSPARRWACQAFQSLIAQRLPADGIDIDTDRIDIDIGVNALVFSTSRRQL